VAEYGLKEGYHAFITGKKHEKNPSKTGNKKKAVKIIFLYLLAQIKKKYYLCTLKMYIQKQLNI
jgi:hypothetical protein